jgi:hypothetical protein
MKLPLSAIFSMLPLVCPCVFLLIWSSYFLQLTVKLHHKFTGPIWVCLCDDGVLGFYLVFKYVTPVSNYPLVCIPQSLMCGLSFKWFALGSVFALPHSTIVPGASSTGINIYVCSNL